MGMEHYSYATTITTKVLRLLYGIKQSISGIVSWLQNGFQAARQSVHNAIVAEFGNPHLSREDFNAENLEDNVADQEGQQSPEQAGSAGIELDEFPHRTGCPGDVEMAGQITSGEQIWKNGRGLMTASKPMHHSCASNAKPLAVQHAATYINPPF
ncbi:hypothetical protein JB92DRAFT_2834429 [Gautieria morchelliformis]|nr:hypothetical protein JB92DRAFT_2834429 [Gautieria morchelliformis]